jgi:hypothetical protein
VAIFYSRMSTVCRSKGHSAVAAAAYRAGARLVDERAASTHDFTKRRGVLSSTMLAPTKARWALDVEKVWARAEHIEVRRNARTARELVVALPAELTDQENVALAQQLGQDLVDAYGVAVLVAVHEPDAHGDARNAHVHLLMSTRVAGADGFGAKVRLLDDKAAGPHEARALRARVAERLNAALERAGHAARVDPRTLAEQASSAAERGDLDAVIALTREPTKHQGPAATALARRGVTTPVVASNDQVRTNNTALRAWGARRAGELRLAARVRAERRARAPRTIRGQELRKGLGAVGSLRRAEGADAELLNAQARSQENTMRAERDGVEKYLDVISQAADAQAIGLRETIERGRQAAEREATALAQQRALREARAAWDAAAVVSERAKDAHERQRRVVAKAQHDVARAVAKEHELEAAEPRAWRVLSRRAWAEHRRRQRREVEQREALEQAATQDARLSAETFEKAQGAERIARRAFKQVRRSAAKTRRSSTQKPSEHPTANEPSEICEKTLVFSVETKRPTP